MQLNCLTEAKALCNRTKKKRKNTTFILCQTTVICLKKSFETVSAILRNRHFYEPMKGRKIQNSNHAPCMPDSTCSIYVLHFFVTGTGPYKWVCHILGIVRCAVSCVTSVTNSYCFKTVSVSNKTLNNPESFMDIFTKYAYKPCFLEASWTYNHKHST